MNSAHLDTCKALVAKRQFTHEQESLYFQKATLNWAARSRMNDIQYGVAL
jgi:hypothetical protein